MPLNHPQTIPSMPPPQHLSMEKLFSVKPVPGIKNVGDHGSRAFYEPNRFYTFNMYSLI